MENPLRRITELLTEKLPDIWAVAPKKVDVSPTLKNVQAPLLFTVACVASTKEMVPAVQVKLLPEGITIWLVKLKLAVLLIAADAPMVSV